ncbi:family 78 glycoside hydrolase catalytic domain [Dactylosporangium sucinum]|uniref:family 78 glycoside hydrolase catalytic domain n=1 Tax=Dactylosporangium sucinum TaxID=1424081 RepID=UPI001E2CB901|nr:family 78 glycoside hydrolase catalytic domain [Dactylosporangium sucinum]
MGEWDSGRVESASSVLVEATGLHLQSLQDLSWRVRVWTDLGPSDWSAPERFSTGLLTLTEWVSTWIGPREATPLPPGGHRPAYWLKGEFDLGVAVRRATLLATAHGLYEAFVNGARVGDQELTPGSTAYAHRTQVQSFDVTSMLHAGRNDLSALLSDGWYRSVSPHMKIADGYGARTAFLAQLHIELEDGTGTVFGTGPGWVFTPSSITAVELTRGQHQDQRITSSDWQPALCADLGHGTLVGPVAPPVRQVEELPAVAVRRLPNGAQVVDVGQNVNGWVRLRDAGPAGSRVSLVHGEALDADGDVTIEHLHFAHLDGVAQTDSIVSAGNDEPYEPRHTTKGFRYVSITGHPRDLAPADLTAKVVHSDLERTGDFACSNADLNRLHEISDWSFRGNACDVPTDCPTRERAGWTGDWQLFMPTAAFLYDVAGFNAKWLYDLAAQQLPSGGIPTIVPDRHESLRGEYPFEAEFFATAAGWADAAAHVPWQHWLHYEDHRLLDQLYPTMLRWVELQERIAREERHSSRTGDRQPHEAFLLDTRFQFGEWLEPDETDDTIHSLMRLEADMGVVATGYFFRSAQQVAAAAAVLGHDADARRLAGLAEQVRRAWQIEYLAPDGTIAPGTQANYARALSFDLVPGALRAEVAANLVAIIRKAGTHVGTGFLTTPMLLPVLADNGHVEVAYELLLQRTEPSWMTMLDRGATTVWERWDGLDEQGVPSDSLNHYSKGAVISFLHTHVAGIRLLPGFPAYRRFLVQPQPGGGLTWARARLDTPYGPIESAWRQQDGRLHLSVTVAPGTTAEVRLPDGAQAELPPGTHSLVSDLP